MPLSTPVSRQLSHHRSIQCYGYQREDGLWDIEAHLVDTKTFVFHTQSRGDLPPGIPVHDMWLRLTVDDNLLIHGIDVASDAFPFHICPTIAHRFQLLKGVKIDPGWTRTIKELLGGVKGCTHLVELLGPVATTAFQTVYAATRTKREQEMAANPDKKPAIIDTCHAFASDSMVVKHYFPRFYTGT